MRRRKRKPVDPQALADAIAVLYEVIRQYPGSGLAMVSKVSLELRDPALIFEAAEVLGRRLESSQRPADAVD